MPVCAYCADDRPRWAEAWTDLYSMQADMIEDADLLLAGGCDVDTDNLQMLIAQQRLALAKQIEYRIAMESRR